MKTKFKTLTKSKNKFILENNNFLNNQNYVINSKIRKHKLYLINKTFTWKIFLKVWVNIIHSSKLIYGLKEFFPFIAWYLLFMTAFILIILSGQNDSWIIWWIIFINVWFLLAIYWFFKNWTKRNYKYKLYKDKDYYIINKYYPKKYKV